MFEVVKAYFKLIHFNLKAWEILAYAFECVLSDNLISIDS